MTEQIGLFESLYDKYETKHPIRLIELFAGYGSQSLALKYLGVEFTHWRICEWATKSIQAYNDIHIRDYTDYSERLTSEELIKRLTTYGVSMNYNEPMSEIQIKRKGEQWQRETYNNIQATHNLVDISKAKAQDLGITETDKYTYIMTYSFPCQDLSLAGKLRGMSRDSGTRSGMLWQVERILDECEELPQILLMENVQQVIGKKNIEDFNEWKNKLGQLGYTNHIKVLNAKNYGIPQNRVRAFMVSILGEYSYTFPKEQPLKIKLKDTLEKEVDEKYYLSDTMIKYITYTGTGNFHNNDSKINLDIARPITTDPNKRAGTTNYLCQELPDNYDLKELGELIQRGGNLEPKIAIKEATKKGYAEATDGDGVYIANIKGKRGTVQKGMIQTIKTSPDVGVVVSVKQNLRIRKLTPRECWRLMGVKDEDSNKAATNQSNSSLYHLAGDSIVTTVLMAIFGELLNIDYESKINELTKEIISN